MNHDQPKLDEQEQQMLAHFRQHSGGEPSAQLDAQILAAAHAAVAQVSKTQAAPGWAARVQHGLFGAGRQRWSVALAGVACLGIGVSLTWRTFEQAPDAFDAVPQAAPMAPAAARMHAPVMLMPAPVEEAAVLADEPPAHLYSGESERADKKRLSVVAPQISAEPASDVQAPAAAQAPAPTTINAEANLLPELQRLLRLRREGARDEANALLLQLMDEHPHVDIEAQLRLLQPPE
ncbi:hypothetical protein [Pseudomonas sp. Ga0074129]|uniref:hypothetical protein n=1 Tax=Pseudomonas sp. Ga0074129 TaxID=1752219 RepID=UPI000AB15E6A|nr:hypothetical protein [Pseudomonas sp. Ga0074129]